MSFPNMRRSKQLLSNEKCLGMLNDCPTGFLGVNGFSGYPYVVPLNFVYWNESIYFHCARSGHKLDSIIANPKVSFCVVAQDDVLPETFSTAYRSVIVFGKAFVVDDPDERLSALTALGLKYNPDESKVQAEIKPSFERTTIVRIECEHITGKQALNLMQG